MYLKKRILLTLIGFFLTIILTTISLSLSLYHNFEKVSLNMLNDSTSKLLTQVKQTTQYIEEVITLSGMHAFYSNPVTILREKENPSNFEMIEGIRSLNSLSSVSPHIHSIYVYNKKANYVYSNSNIFSNSTDKFADPDALNLLLHTSSNKRLKLIPRQLNIPYSNTTQKIYSMLLYETNAYSEAFSNAIIINVHAEWINTLFSALSNDNSFFVLNTKGDIITDNTAYEFMNNIADQPHIHAILNSQSPNGHFFASIDGKKNIIMYVYSPDTNWYYVRQIPYLQAMKDLIIMKSNTVYQIIFIISIATLISFLALIKLYIPFNKIIYSVEHANPTTTPTDFNALIHTIEDLANSSHHLAYLNSTYNALLKEEFLKALLSNSFKKSSIMTQNFTDYHLSFTKDKPFYLVLIKDSTPSLYKDYLTQLNPPFTFECVFLQPYVTIIFQNISTSQLLKLCDELIHLQNAPTAYSSSAIYLKDLAAVHKRLIEVIHYSIFFPPLTLLDTELLHHKSNHFVYPVDLEQQLITDLKKGDLESAMNLYHKLICSLQDFRFESIKFSIKRLYLTTHLLCDKLTQSNASDLNCVSYIEQTLNTLTSFEEMDKLFYTLFSQITTYVDHQKHSKGVELATQIKEIIDINFADPSLSLQAIAHSLSMSPIYIGRVFKSIEGMSVSEYINHCRISKTQELLISTSLTVKEIALSVGFISDTYLYTLFKNHTGHTPKEFRQNMISPFC